MWVMVSGPYTSGGDRAENLRAMNRMADKVFRAGHVPVIGVNAALPVIEAGADFDATMMPLSLALAERCEGVLRIGGPSRGADDEVERFRRMGRPVWRSVDELPAADPPLTLYGSGTSRWVRPLWLLRELGADHRVVEVDRAGGELDSPAFRALNPSGRIPVLVVGTEAIAESLAIVLFLVDRFPGPGLAPGPGTVERGRHDRWLMHVATELEPPLWWLHRHRTYGEGPPEGEAVAAERASRAAALVERHLAQRPWLLGERFTAADLVLASLLTWRVAADLVDAHPRLREHRDRAVARPVFPGWLYVGT